MLRPMLLLPHRKSPRALALASLALLGCSRGGQDDPAGDGGVMDLRTAGDLGSAGDLRPMPSAEVSFGPAATYPASQFAYHFAVGRIDASSVE